MTNSEITNVMLGDTEASALYMGDRLVWQRGYGENTFACKFTDDSTDYNWFFTVYLDSGSKNYQYVEFSTPTPNVKIEEKDLPSSFNRIEFGLNCKPEHIYHLPKVFSQAKSCYNMFCPKSGNSSLKSIELRSFDASNVTDMYYMFRLCDSLEYVDLSSLETSKVVDMSGMFEGCISLPELDLSNFNITKVQYMNKMFYRCTALSKINLGSMDFTNVLDTVGLLGECTSLSTVIGNIRGLHDSIHLGSCPLTNESAMVFINGLAEITAYYPTITFSAQTYDTLTSAQIAIATSKGWNVVRG